MHMIIIPASSKKEGEQLEIYGMGTLFYLIHSCDIFFVVFIRFCICFFVKDFTDIFRNLFDDSLRIWIQLKRILEVNTQQVCFGSFGFYY